MRTGPTTSVTRCFTFDAGHRVYGHEGKCKHLHGHTYKAEVTVTADDLDGLGRVIDFSVLKEKVGGWIDEHWDHNLLLNTDDPLYTLFTLGHPTVVGDFFGGKQPYLFHKSNPTAENIARELFYKVELLLGNQNIHPVHVRVWETPNCYAEYDDFDYTYELSKDDDKEAE